EAEGKGGASRFACEAAAPKGRGQAPTDLDAWCEWCAEAWHQQADCAHQRCDTRRLHSPEPETLAFEMSSDARDERVALRTGQPMQQELCCALIRIQAGEGLEVLVLPRAKDKARGDQARGVGRRHAVALSRFWLGSLNWSGQ